MRIRRAVTRLTVLSAVVGGVLAAPTVTPAWATPHPVEPETTTATVQLGSTEVTTKQADFSLVGATLPDDGSVNAADVQVRTRSDDGTWSQWQSLEENDSGPDAGTAEAASAHKHVTEPVWVGSSDAAQVRRTPDSTDPDSASNAPAKQVQLTLIDPKSSRADTNSFTPASTAHAASTQPRIVTRAQWGADESLRTRNPGCDGTASYSSTIRAGILHHTVNDNDYGPNDVIPMIRAIYGYHVISNGWCDIGYNFIVDKWGNIYEGRAGGVDKAVIGAHAGGFNTNTFGVSMLGNFESASPPPAMMAGVQAVMGWKLSLYNRDPLGYTTLTSAGGGTARFPAGQDVVVPVVLGHRDVGATACPGNGGYAQLPGVRAAATTVSGYPSFIRALYQDMLRRGAADSEVAAWLNVIALTRNKDTAVNGFTNSTEYRINRIEAAYQSVLVRGVDPTGLTSWLGFLNTGQIRLDDLPRILMQSPEFYVRGGGTDKSFVNTLYKRALHREAADSEQAAWAAIIASQGRAAGVAGVYDSVESGLIRVDAAYQTWLGRGAGPAERAHWVNVVLGGGDESMRAALMVSQEYFDRAQARFS